MALKKTSSVLARLLLVDSPQRKKADILATYMRIVVEEGLTSATLTRLAKEHRTSKALIHYHMPDFEKASLELFKMSAALGVEFTKSLWQSARGPQERLHAILRAPFLWVFEYPDFAHFVTLMYHRASVDPEVHALHKKNIEEGRRRIVEVLRPFVKKTSKLDFMAAAIHNQMIASFILMISMRDLKKDSHFVSNYEKLIQELLSMPFEVFPKKGVTDSDFAMFS